MNNPHPPPPYIPISALATVEGDCLTPAERWHNIAVETANLVVTKNAAYGDSHAKSGEVMRVLYPSGIPLDKLDDALTIVRVVDKLFRIATDRDALGEDPWRDVMGYALLAAERRTP